MFGYRSSDCNLHASRHYLIFGMSILCGAPMYHWTHVRQDKPREHNQQSTFFHFSSVSEIACPFFSLTSSLLLDATIAHCHCLFIFLYLSFLLNQIAGTVVVWHCFTLLYSISLDRETTVLPSVRHHHHHHPRLPVLHFTLYVSLPLRNNPR